MQIQPLRVSVSKQDMVEGCAGGGGGRHSAAGLLRESRVQSQTSGRNKHLVSHRTLIVLGEPEAGEYWDM